MEEYESERRGPFQGIIRVVGRQWCAGIRHSATMAVENGPRFDDQASAEQWVEAQLEERVPDWAPAPVLAHAVPHALQRLVRSPVTALPPHLEPKPCPMCSLFFLADQLNSHIRKAHPDRVRHPLPAVIRSPRKKAPSSKTPSQQLHCQFCRERVLRYNYIRHIRHIHLLGSDTRLWTDIVGCIFCSDTIMLGDYPRHLKDHHTAQLIRATKNTSE